MILDHNGNDLSADKKREHLVALTDELVQPLLNKGYTLEELDFVGRSLLMSLVTTLTPVEAANYCMFMMTSLEKQINAVLQAKHAEAKIAENLQSANDSRLPS